MVHRRIIGSCGRWTVSLGLHSPAFQPVQLSSFWVQERRRIGTLAVWPRRRTGIGLTSVPSDDGEAGSGANSMTASQSLSQAFTIFRIISFQTCVSSNSVNVIERVAIS